MASAFCKPVYEIWLSEEIKSGRISISNYSQTPLIKNAWNNSEWIGISQPSIDPLKESKAATERIAQGTTTREREAQLYNGSDYHTNVEKLKTENKKLKEAQLELEFSQEPING